MAQAGFAGIQFSYSGLAYSGFSYSGGSRAFFNTSTGDVREYGDHGNFRNHYRVHESGKDRGR
jgi:hypothetical protein